MDPFAVIAEPSRRRILDLLRDGERSVNELSGALRASQPTVSKHLRVLRDAGMVEVRVDAQHRRYRLEPGALAVVDAWIAPFRRRPARQIDALEAYLAGGPPPRD